MNKFIIKQYNQKMTKIVPILLVFLISCTSTKPIVMKTSFSTIYKNAYAGAENAGFLHLTNNEDFIQYIESLKLDESQYNSFLAINFKENDVLVLNQGRKNTGGYAIDVAKIYWENETLIIQKMETFPKNGEPVTMALTAPFCITIIPKAKSIKIME